ncbi:hypothetical protein J6590_065271 [Homalodisca vitripennis]|nr:hypothetical protein J6590_065271 [Homalodisca vitripennis]
MILAQVLPTLGLISITRLMGFEGRAPSGVSSSPLPRPQSPLPDRCFLIRRHFVLKSKLSFRCLPTSIQSTDVVCFGVTAEGVGGDSVILYLLLLRKSRMREFGKLLSLLSLLYVRDLDVSCVLRDYTLPQLHVARPPFSQHRILDVPGVTRGSTDSGPYTHAALTDQVLKSLATDDTARESITSASTCQPL